MQDSPHNQSHTLKIVSIIAIAVVCVSLVGLATVLVLRTAVPKKATTPIGAARASAATAADVTSAFKDTPINALAATTYDLRQGTTATGGSIYYRADDQSYTITTPTQNNLIFTAKSITQADDTKTVQDQTNTFMTQMNLSKADTPVVTTSPQAVLTTYTNDKTVCQLTDNHIGSSTPGSHAPSGTALHSFHQLACASKEDIEKEYAATRSLLSLDTTTKQLTNLRQVSRTVITEGDKSLAFLSTTDTEGKVSRYLFAAIKGDWEYIGDLTSGGDSHAAKYQLSGSVKKAINDPKYGDFLTKYVH